ncbi:MAG: ABC transporter permease [Dehalococcoidia bacterium]
MASVSDATAYQLEQYALRRRPGFPERARRSLLRFIRYKPLGAFGAVFVIILLLMAAVPSLFPNTGNPDANSIVNRFQGPSAEHWFGTDQFGRDLYTRIIYGARTSILIGTLVVLVSASVATFLGVTSGYFGGIFDLLVQRVVDIGIALPGLIFIILVVTSLTQFPPAFLGLEPSGRVVVRIAVAVGILTALGQSRVIRGAAIATKQNQYVEAARVIGASDVRIISRHVVPNVIPIIIIGASIQIGGAILTESSLAFLGYGVQPPTASWGRMLNEAREALSRHPHLAIFPGLAIFLTVYSFNMLGDALRDVLDPRLRGTR